MKRIKSIKSFVRVLLLAASLVLPVSLAAEAYLVPGPSNGDDRPAPYPGDRGGGHGDHRGDHGGGGSAPDDRHYRRPYPSNPYPSNPYPGYPPSNPYPGNPYPGNPYPSDPYPGYPPSNPYPGNPGYGGTEVKRIYIGRTVNSESLRLRILAGLNRQYSGWEVVSVRASTRPVSSSTTIADLSSYGRVVARQINPGYQIYLIPQSRLVLTGDGSSYDGSENSLLLSIGGATFIDTIEIELRNGGGGYNPPPPGYGQNIEISLYRSVYGSERIDLTQYIDMYRYRGRIIERVLVTATSRVNTGFISLLINSFNMGQARFSGGYSQIATFHLNQQMVIGQGADSIVLNAQGDMSVERVTLVIR